MKSSAQRWQTPRVLTTLGLVLLLGLSGCDLLRSDAHLFPAESIPEQLSAWKLLKLEKDTLFPTARAVPYDLNTGLFTDYAHKFRTVWLPEGSAALYGVEQFDYPVGTILTKTFYYPQDSSGALQRTGDFSGDYVEGRFGEVLDLKRVRLVETRLLIRRQDNWQALPYVWNDAQTEATLEIAGDVQRFKLVSGDGRSEELTYVVPDANQCAGCHAEKFTQRVISPLGPKARHLNRDYPYPGGAENQLLFWQKIGFLRGVPALERLPRNASIDDLTVPLEDRARAYLDINCGHCHNPSGPADTSGLMLHRGESDWRKLGLCKPPIAAGTGSGGHLFAIVPGEPENSILNFRVASTAPGAMMPELGRSLVHKEGVELLRQWVSSLSGSCI
ncbi:SO2930 family diheme c-type cytochrome [Microbulbifer sp. ZKSA006]|uniref:SO2930 family diheme c-type cytochrome n=1 Tax=Microbulbifer sp. ZKSA006 TaxID=3243390 RepID=UPI00403948B2